MADTSMLWEAWRCRSRAAHASRTAPFPSPAVQFPGATGSQRSGSTNVAHAKSSPRGIGSLPQSLSCASRVLLGPTSRKFLRRVWSCSTCCLSGVWIAKGVGGPSSPCSPSHTPLLAFPPSLLPPGRPSVHCVPPDSERPSPGKRQ